MQNKNLPNFEEEVLEGDDITNIDIKINPDFYIHHALVNAQKSLLTEDLRSGFLKYWSFIEHIEILCRCANMIPSDYETLIDDYKKSEEYKEIENDMTKNVRLANKKLSLIMGEVFNRKTVTEPLKVK